MRHPEQLRLEVQRPTSRAPDTTREASPWKPRNLLGTVRSELFVPAVVMIVLAVSFVGAPETLRAQQPVQPAPPAVLKPGQKPAVAVPDGSFNVVADAPLRSAPGADMIGNIRKGANLDVIARDRGWARVRMEAWVPDSVLAPADASYRANLSAADLRADPVAARGKTVVWNVEYLALQSADPLRHGLADEEPYMLARGPNSENALLYLVVPPSLMGTVRALKPLARITVTARVRDGKSDPVGVPILDVETISRIR